MCWTCAGGCGTCAPRGTGAHTNTFASLLGRLPPTYVIVHHTPPSSNTCCGQAHGIVFNSLLCLNNMPIKRFADWLLRQGLLEEYMGALVSGVPGMLVVKTGRGG